MKVLALTVGDEKVASTQYRLGQFVEPLREKGVMLDLVPAAHPDAWPRLEDYDLVMVQKRLMRLSRVREVRVRSRRLIFDTDDAIWEPHGKRHSLWTRLRTRSRLKAIVKAADLCTVANRHLADALRPAAKSVEVIPMALDPRIWHPAPLREPGPLRIGWAGAPPNLIYLERLGKILAEVQRLKPDTELVVYCGKEPKWPDAVKWRQHFFQPGTEADVVRTFDIGLLPLPDDAFAAGKSPIKALQYAACGIPCIASPVGTACEMVKDGITGMLARSDEEWLESLLRLLDGADERARLGEAARAHFLQKHASPQVLGRMMETWENLLEK